MTWFFNHEGTADGPHDEPSMLDFIKAGRVTARTLIWHEGLPLWQEAGTLQAVWWQSKEAAATQLKEARARQPSKGADTGPARRSPTPIAPTEEAPKPKVGFFRRLFGRKD